MAVTKTTWGYCDEGEYYSCIICHQLHCANPYEPDDVCLVCGEGLEPYQGPE